MLIFEQFAQRANDLRGFQTVNTGKVFGPILLKTAKPFADPIHALRILLSSAEMRVS